ncbi:WD repeat domain-containing protein [Pleurostoma richardsiae]|uniref:WD repeat domain-containing protein n=1 Tax=Pleurostoma richardsiae TaxID=41990 RepID=A0AA38S514_9PEZI|nr:WD repeat domain-containing protein [Pleurostoma richardsiae]
MAATASPISVALGDTRQGLRGDGQKDLGSDKRLPKLSPLIEKSPSLPPDHSQSASGTGRTNRSPTTPSDGQGNQIPFGSLPKKTPVKLGRNSLSAGPGLKEKDYVDDGQRASPSTARATPPPPTSPSVSTPNNVAIDPLSQHIFMRTNTDHSTSKQSRLRTSTPVRPESPAATGEPIPRHSSDLTTRQGIATGDVAKDRKKGVSFLSRLSMRTSKKAKDDDILDSDSEFSGGPRTDGTNARVFSSIVGSGGYIPHHKEPPRYIRIRAQHKRDREFNRMFLAQELVGTHPKRTADGEEEKAPVVTVSVAGAGGRRREKTGGAIWATEFSKDGKYLAAAGRDAVVRVWAVISTQEDRKLHEEEEAANGVLGERLSAPVFIEQPVREFTGHSGEILDLTWSKNNFLLSTSMDKTVRLWHVSRKECLCTFKHKDLVTKVAFHPTDDRFFLAGSLDTTLRLWSIPDKTIAYSVQLPDLITAVAFSPDGRIAIAGLLNGLCMFYETEGLKYTSQIHAKSSRGKNSKGSKITGIQTMVLPAPGQESESKDPPEVKVLISTNDSRIRIYGMKSGMLDVKLKGHENAATQISASFSDDGRYIISGSEDRKTFIWGTRCVDSDTKDKHPSESFDAHGDIVTTALFAPTRTRQLLSASGDPIYDLCNPPPVTLLPTDETAATASQSALSDHSQIPEPLPTPTVSIKKPEESPAYLERCKHYDGNIIVTSDYQGIIKVFRQDCAFVKRRHESWETGSNFSRRIASGNLTIGRSGSLLTRNSMSSAGHSRRGSLSAPLPPGITLGQPSVAGMPQLTGSDRILSWRQGIENGRPLSLVGGIGTPTRSERSLSPSKNMRTPVSGSRANLAADARKQQYASASPNQTRATLSSAGNGVSLPTSPVASQASVASPTLASAADAAQLRVSKGRESKEQGRKSTDTGEPASPPVPSFSFRPADEEEDTLRLDPAGASYSFWNINRWKGIAGLRNSISGPPSSHSPPNSSPTHTRTSNDTVSATESDKDRERERIKAAHRKSVGPVFHHSPLAGPATGPPPADAALTPTPHDNPVDATPTSKTAAARRRSLPAGMVSTHLSPLASGASTPSRGGGGGGDDPHHLLAQLPSHASRDPSPYLRAGSVVSKLSSELLTSEEEENGEGEGEGEEDGEEMRCARCGGMEFKARRVAGRQRLVCGRCGAVVEEGK